MDRRKFIGTSAAGATAAGAAIASTPTDLAKGALGFKQTIPREVIRESAKPAQRFLIELIEMVDGKKQKAKGFKPQPLVFVTGDLENPSPGDVLKSDPIKWECTLQAVDLWGVRVWGGKLNGRVWAKFAPFTSFPPSLHVGSTIVVGYNITADDEV